MYLRGDIIIAAPKRVVIEADQFQPWRGQNQTREMPPSVDWT